MVVEVEAKVCSTSYCSLPKKLVVYAKGALHSATGGHRASRTNYP